MRVNPPGARDGDYPSDDTIAVRDELLKVFRIRMCKIPELVLTGRGLPTIGFSPFLKYGMMNNGM